MEGNMNLRGAGWNGFWWGAMGSLNGGG